MQEITFDTFRNNIFINPACWQSICFIYLYDVYVTDNKYSISYAMPIITIYYYPVI